ncbi:MAG: hypothetical protein AB7K52_09715 [Phycisphaerales bacterium]
MPNSGKIDTRPAAKRRGKRPRGAPEGSHQGGAPRGSTRLEPSHAHDQVRFDRAPRELKQKLRRGNAGRGAGVDA